MRALLPVLALATVATLAGCSSRAHLNPFDPSNPITAGKPAGFAALAGNGFVQMRWAAAPPGIAVGFQIYRRVAGETDFKPVTAVLPATASSYLDYGLLNGVRHDYQLYFVLSGARSGLPAEDYATPGSRRVWFTDLQSQTLLRVTADGHRVANALRGFYGPSSLAYDPANLRTWVSDTYDGRVVGVDADDVARYEITGLSEPVSLAVDTIGVGQSGGNLWVCDQARDAVFHYTLAGTPKSPTSLGSINTPIGAAVDPNDGTLWICERGADRVRRFNSGGTPTGGFAVIAPSRVAVDSISREVWVTSFDAARVVRLSPAGVAEDTIAFSGPIGIAVDPRHGRIWVADAVAGDVVALRRSGVVEFRIGGLPRVRDVAVDVVSGECFATVPGLASLVRISPTGVMLERIAGFSDAFGVAVAP